MDLVTGITEITNRLGGETVKLGIKAPTIKAHLLSAVRQYTRYVPRNVTLTLPVELNIVTLPAETLVVKSVLPTSLSERGTISVDPYDVFNVSNTNSTTSGFGSQAEILAETQLRQAELRYTTQCDWFYDRAGKRLILTDGWTNDVTVTIATSYSSFDVLEEHDLIWVLDYAECLALKSEGRIRRKYTNDFLQMDGSEMVSEGSERQRTLEEELRGQMLLDFGGRA